MPVYFDSNILIAILQKEQNSDRAVALWSENRERTSSFILEIECITVLRRVWIQARQKLPDNWFSERIRELQNFLQEAEIQNMSDTILHTLKTENFPAECRALDAIHLATALDSKKAGEEPFYFCTFDRRLAKLAKSAGLKLLTAES